MSLKETINLIKSDWKRFGYEGETWFTILLNPSFIVSFWLRIGFWLRAKRNVLSKLLYALTNLINRINGLLTGIQVPLSTHIGGGIRFKHHSCIVIAGSAVIGECCTIHQGVTIGRTFSGKKAGVPILEDHVVIFPGAKVIGNIKIGSHVVIGANAVVVEDIPANCVVAGVPAKIISYDSSKCFDGVWKKVHGF